MMILYQHRNCLILKLCALCIMYVLLEELIDVLNGEAVDHWVFAGDLNEEHGIYSTFVGAFQKGDFESIKVGKDFQQPKEVLGGIGVFRIKFTGLKGLNFLLDGVTNLFAETRIRFKELETLRCELIFVEFFSIEL